MDPGSVTARRVDEPAATPAKTIGTVQPDAREQVLHLLGALAASDPTHDRTVSTAACLGKVLRQRGEKHISLHSYTPNCNHKVGSRPFKAITDASFTRGRCRHPPAFIKLKRAIQGYDQHVLRASKPTNPQASVPQHTRPPRTRLGQIPLVPTLNGNGQLYAWSPAVYPACAELRTSRP